MTDTEIIDKYHELRSCKAVAEFVGCNLETIRRVLIKNGVQRTGWKQTPEYALPKKKYKWKNRGNCYKPVSYNVVCAFCGKEFVSHNKRKRYCSKKCKDASRYKEVKIFNRVCPVCGNSFSTNVHNKIFCSSECSNRRNKYTWEEYVDIRKKKAEQNAVNRELKKIQYKADHTIQRECEECGSLFFCLDTSRKFTCSHECSRKRANRTRDKRIPNEQKKDNISLKRLYKRDNGICYLCGCSCDWNDWDISENGNKYPGVSYPTIEHVIPVSKGGLNSWDNVRLACWKCNLEKADGIIEIDSLSREFAYSQKHSATMPKKTAQFTLDGTLIKIWSSTAEIKRELGLNDKHIQNVCRGDNSNTGNAYGYHWEYVV